MAKELFIVFLYDTEVHLREEEDPQSAVVFFHPSWVNANQRMALCGQLIGVTQFLASGFQFPHTISLQSGKFCMKQIGKFILCVGTDRNISEWILEERCEILYETLKFFHNDFSTFSKSSEQKTVSERLGNAMEVYLPVLLYAGNIFGNSLTVHLPKSASSIFLEAAQVLECLQNNEGVYGGAIFYRNKILMTQLNADITKQIVVVDPYRIKIPAEIPNLSFKLPSELQLLVVFVDESELINLDGQKISINSKTLSSNPTTAMDESTGDAQWTKTLMSTDRAGIFTVKEEEAISEQSPSTNETKCIMPDVVRDTVKTVKEKLEKKNKFADVKINSFVIHPCTESKLTPWSSCENVSAPSKDFVKYSSFDNSSEKLNESVETSRVSRRKRSCYYNTISDPTNPWFRCNGLPVSQAFKDDQIAPNCQSANKLTASSNNEKKLMNKVEFVVNSARPSKRPTSIKISSQNGKEKQSRLQKSLNLLRDLKREFADSSLKKPTTGECDDVLLTPLMSKLSMLDLSQRNIPPVLTPAPSLAQMSNEESTTKGLIQCNSKRKMKSKSRRKHLSSSQSQCIKKAILLVFGYQNMSVYLLLNEGSETNDDLILDLWKICINSVKDLEEHFEQCVESVPQTQEMNSINESYSHLNLHSVWETLHQGGNWTGPQVDLLNTMHNDFNLSKSITDIIFRMDDSIVYGNQMADSQMFYQQSAPMIAGLPMPSDPMGIVPVKAKRRLERDHGILIL